MAALTRELKLSLRNFREARALHLAVIACFAVGIGASTAIFSVMDALVLRPLPFADPDRLVALSEVQQAPGGKPLPLGLSVVTYEAVRERRVFTAVGSYHSAAVNLRGGTGAERVEAGLLTPGLAELLGARPRLGRLFVPAEALPRDTDVVLLSHGAWQRRFGGRPDVTGQKVIVDGTPSLIVGVLPASFDLPTGSELWQPLSFAFPDPRMRFWHLLNVVGRLRPGESMAQAQAELAAVSRHLAETYPATHGGWTLTLAPLRRDLAGDRGPLPLAMTAGAAFLLAIACANAVNLLLVRSIARGRTLAVLSACGARPAALLRQSLLDSMLFALAGGGIGVALAALGIRPLAALFPADQVPPMPITVNPRVLLFALATSLASGLAAGLVPALRARRPDLAPLLKDGGRGSSGQAAVRLQSGLAAAEIAITLVLLAAAALLFVSLRTMLREDPGFHSSGLLTIHLDLSAPPYADDGRRIAFLARLLADLRGLPGVREAGLTSTLPVGDRDVDLIAGISAEGRAALHPGDVETTRVRQVSAGYLRLMGIPLLAGREFDSRDDARAPRVVLVGQALAQRLWPHQSPLGKRIKHGAAESEAPWLTVVGVAGDVKDSLTDRSRLLWYEPFTQVPPPVATVVLRSAGPPDRLLAPVRAAVRALDEAVPVYGVASMQEVLRQGAAANRFGLGLIGGFALVGLLLAAFGLHGTIAYAVSQRRREIGIRLALGARRQTILGQILGRALALAIVGVVAGLGTTLVATRLLAAWIYGVSPTDAGVLATVSVLLVGVTLAAALVAARRAARVEPVIALRQE